MTHSSLCTCLQQHVPLNCRHIHIQGNKGKTASWKVSDQLSPVGRHLQTTSPPGAYVQAQIAILTSGNMATSLQVQLNATIVDPHGLLLTLQQHGLAVTGVTLQSLDVEQVSILFPFCDEQLCVPYGGSASAFDSQQDA